MQFPIQSKISPEKYGPNKVGVVLRISGNAGQIPPAFQYAVLTEAVEQPGGGSEQVCDTNVCQMTPDQWDAWLDQDAETYILECVAENLDLELVKNPAKTASTSGKKSR